jgi:hypothetical protein
MPPVKKNLSGKKRNEKKNKSKGCLAFLVVLGLVGSFLGFQQVYYLREHSGYTRLLANDQVIYLVVGTSRIGDRCSLLTEVVSFFMWQPSAVHQRDSVTVTRISRAGMEQFTHMDMSIRGTFFLDNKDLVYLKTKTDYEEWRPVWVWRKKNWDTLPMIRAQQVQRAYAVYAERKAVGKLPRTRMWDISHSSLWSRRETRLTMQGQSFHFKTKIMPSPRNNDRELRHLEVEGLYGFREILLDEDQSWQAVGKGEYQGWFGAGR